MMTATLQNGTPPATLLGQTTITPVSLVGGLGQTGPSTLGWALLLAAGAAAALYLYKQRS